MEVTAKLPPPSAGKVVTILSIDGGGVRGIIPAILLMKLEEELQKVSGHENARIADYFDLIAGTSTGGIITAMLTAPDGDYRPMFSAPQIKDFYRKESPGIFPPKNWFKSIWNYLYKPKYDGEYLHGAIQFYLEGKRLHDTLTRVVIPTFDMKQVRPTIFSSLKLNTEFDVLPGLDAQLSDICIGTSAAPTYLPPYPFKNGETEFNLIDGGIIANNPALIAISEVTQQITKNNPDFSTFEPNDYTRIVLVSFGTGFMKPNVYNAKDAQKWGILKWAKPSIEFALDGSQDLVDYHLASVFHALGADSNYLRIQTDVLSENMADLDCATEKNLGDLEALAKNLLNQTETRMNLDTFKLEPIPGGPTNAEAIEKMAEILVTEKRERLANITHSSIRKVVL
ncbi:patatin-like protein 1 isoform X2 [Prosopis cineraria]|uniref:patatin-like protein 1 isoform X2 n=1 Tax=Prosopis cineraria TaxID=364024 RepID=UPI00241086BE|nr:patatin-like protein 1 isoform X2 [Prosopis cineraria]